MLTEDFKKKFKKVEAEYLHLKQQIDEDTQSESESERLSEKVTDFSDVVKLIKSRREVGLVNGGY